MPLYEYECQACGHHLEAQQRIADAPLVTCPACNKDQLQKLISASAFHLKGGGWYKDLYASAKPGSSGESGGGSPPAATGGTATGGTATPKAAPAAGAASTPSTSTPSTSTPAPSTPSSGKGGSGSG